MPRPGGHMGVPKKAKDTKKALKNLLAYIKPYLVPMIIALILCAVSAILAIIAPNKLGDISTEMVKPIKILAGTGIWNDIDTNKIQEIGILLIVIYVSSAVASYIAHLILVKITLAISKKLRQDLVEKINRLPLAYFSTNTFGDVLSRITNDVDTITESLNNSLSNLVTAIFQFVGCIIMMFVTEWSMALTAIVASVIGFVLMGMILATSQKYFKARQVALGKLNGYIEEMYSGHDVIRTSGADKTVKYDFIALNKDVKKANFMSQFLSGIMPALMGFIGNLGYVSVCIVGALGVIDGRFEFGVITAFMIYVRLFTQPLNSISQAATQVQSCAAASERVFDFLHEAELDDESNKTTVIENVIGDVKFENVKFSYSSNPDKIIIKNFSCNVKAGQKVAIVGPTGAGKTTLVNLVMRFYEINEGNIYIDGVNIKDVKRENIHNLFGMVLQDTWLYEGTVRENLVFNCTNVADEKIKEACHACGIDTFIDSLPNGYDTVLNDNTSLSAGQKQLFTIARAMIQNSPMLILDEATSNVDTRTEIIIQNAMDKLTEKRTSFVIAHRLSTIKNADLILVMKDGDIIEQGNHNELLSQNGFYATLYNSQFDESNDGSIDEIMKTVECKN